MDIVKIKHLYCEEKLSIPLVARELNERIAQLEKRVMLLEAERIASNVF